MIPPDPVPGAIVRIAGRRGVYRVTDVGPDHITVYGGDLDPGGRRAYRTVTPDRLRPATKADAQRLAHITHNH